MPTDHIRYDILAQNALRGVVRTVMADAARKGLIGDHHFKISFDTTAPGVKLSARLREQYPGEMTIVLQYQFWDLEVSEDAFEVGLSFTGVPERLRVPFDAITGFFDPSVEFGLQFATVIEEESDDDEPDDDEVAAAPPAKGPALVRPEEEKPPAKPASRPRAVPPPVNKAATPDDGDDGDKPSGGAEVVRLDRFRKK